MTINVVSFFRFMAHYNRKTRLKFIAITLGIVILLSLIIAGIFFYWGMSEGVFDLESSLRTFAINLESHSIMITFMGLLCTVIAYGLLMIPILLLALIPKQNVSKEAIVFNVTSLTNNSSEEKNLIGLKD